MTLFEITLSSLKRHRENDEQASLPQQYTIM